MHVIEAADEPELGHPAFDVLDLGSRQGQAQETNERDDRSGTLYNPFHGGLPVSKTA